MTQEYPVFGDRLITVETSSGDMIVEGRDVAAILVSDDEKVDIKDNDNTLRIKSQRGGSRDLHLIVPSRCSLLMRSASGDITLRNVGGQVSAKSMSGQISAHEIGGRFEASSMSGDIVVLGSALSDLDLDTVSGDGLAETTLSEEGRYALNSVSGNLNLRIPEDQGCEIDARSISGNVKCKLPFEGDQNKRGHGKLVVNGGGPGVKMRTTSGDMRIRVAKELPSFEGEPAPEPMAPFQPVAEPEAPRGADAPRETHRLDQSGSEPFAVGEDPAPIESPAERRMAILKQIESGDMTVSEGLAKLRALD